MIRSPRQAPAGAFARPVTSATAAPAMAMITPTLLRISSASTPSAAPTSMVINGKVESASEPRAAVVWRNARLNSTMKNAKYMTPSAATASQSRPRGHLIRSASAIGSNSRNPTPNRNTPSVTGSLVPIANRVVPPATPPKALDATAASTPTYSFRKARMGGQERGPRAAVRGHGCRSRSERKIIVLPRWHLHPFSPQHRERLDDAGARGARHDHVVDIAALGGGEGREEAILVFLGAGGDLLGVADIGAEDDLDRAFCAHYGDLRRRPGIVDVAADMFRRHHVVGAAERLARDHGDERHRGLRIGEEQLRAVLDERAIFLVGAGQESRHVDEGHDRNAERVAEAHEARGLARGIDVEHAREHHGLICDEAHAAPSEAAEAGDDVLGERLLQLEEVAFVRDLEDQFLDVVGLVRIVGDERVERFLLALDVVVRGPLRHAGLVVGG